MLNTVIKCFAFFMLLLFCSFTTKAQFTADDKFIGGWLSFNNHKYSNDVNVGGSEIKSAMFEVRPAIGFFLNEKVAIGGVIGYTSSYQKDVTSSNLNYKNTTQNYSLGCFVNRYFTISEKFYFMLGGNVSYSRGHQETESQFSQSQKAKYHGVNLSIKPSLYSFQAKGGVLRRGLEILVTHTQNTFPAMGTIMISISTMERSRWGLPIILLGPVSNVA